MTSLTLPSRLSGLKLRWPRLALTGETVGVAMGSAMVFASVIAASQSLLAPAPIAPPVAPSMAVRPLAPLQAVAVNSAIPLSNADNPAANAFAFKGNSTARAQAITCLASAVYYEAGREGSDGERAVAQVILNRVRHPAFPSTICGVVFQGSARATGCQFTFTCDGSLSRRPDAAGWRRAQALAAEAITGAVYAPVGWATHYHANYVVPYWAASLAKNAVVGAHLFYHWNGDWGRGNAFSQAYSGREANAEGLRSAALAAEMATGGNMANDLPGSIAAIPGAEAIKLEPSMRGDKRVAVRFNMTARKASDEAVHQDYSAKVEASNNLRWVLSEESTSDKQAAFGKVRPPAAAASPSAVAAPATGQPN
ncbi:MAG: cell wall hydrolase [Sphingomicrobium sp.]